MPHLPAHPNPKGARMSSGFYVGQAVVCIEDFVLIDPRYEVLFTYPLPQKNSVYHIRGLFWDNGMNREGCWLQGLHNPIYTYLSGETMEIGFWVGFFRPIEEKKLPECLTVLLKQPNQLERI
jgi:hypothetical protein